MTSELYTYKAYISSVYDGDTVTAVVELGFNVIFKIKVRLANINTPELRGEEREAGLIARDALREKILNKNVLIKTEKDKTGKYGRYIGTIYLFEPLLVEGEDGDGYVNINNWLVENKYAEIYE